MKKSKLKNDPFKAELEKRLKKAYKKVKKEVKSHFDNCGWDLDAWSVEGDVYYEIFGDIAENILYKMMIELEKPLAYKNGTLVLSNPNYIPVSYNVRKNKIHVGEFKDTIDGEWVYLGPL